MLKNAFKYLGIGFFLSALLLLGLKMTGNLQGATSSTNQQTSTTTTSLVASQTTSTTLATTSAAPETTTQTSQVESGQSVQITMEDGEVSYHLVQKLVDAGIIENGQEFSDYLTNNGLDISIQNGTFTVRKGMTFEELGKIFTTYPGN